MQINREFSSEDIRENKYVFVDMHLHSSYSLDSSNKIKDIIKKAKEKNIGIAITDHNSIGGCLEASKYDVFLIPGIEVTCKEGCHILVYFYDINDLKDFFNNKIKDNMYNEMLTRITQKELIKITNEYRCLISAAHPFGSGNSGIYKLKKYKDMKVVEGLNTSTSKNKNNRAISLKNKLYTAGSDAHIIQHIGNGLVGVKAKNVKDFLDGIKRNKNIIIGKEIDFLDKIKLNLYKEISLIKKMRLKDFIKNRLNHVIK